jgi:hypothetical protein
MGSAQPLSILRPIFSLPPKATMLDNIPRLNHTILPPSSFNPYNVTRLAEFNISMVEIDGDPLLLTCAYGSEFLSKAATADSSEIDIMNPLEVNVGLTSLIDFLRYELPSPLNESSVGQLADWWNDSVYNNTNGTSEFLHTIASVCRPQVCAQAGFVGGIAGIGV